MRLTTGQAPDRAYTPGRTVSALRTDRRVNGDGMINNDDRTIIGDFSRISATATSLDKVYVASPTSLLIWHPQFRRWATASAAPLFLET